MVFSESFGFVPMHRIQAANTHIDPVKEYIRTQEEHHSQSDFIEELKRLLGKHGVEYKAEHIL